MATLNRKRTGSQAITVWDSYIEDKTDWETWKQAVFIESKTPVKMIDKSGKPLEKTLNNGDKVTLLSNKSKKIGRSTFAHVEASGASGLVSLGKIGYSAKNTTNIEDETLASLDALIKSKYNGKNGINIIIKDRRGSVKFVLEGAFGAKTRAGTPKSDFYIHNKTGTSLLEISHKKGGGARVFQQYASVTGIPKDQINSSTILADTLRKFAVHIDTIQKGKRFYTLINLSSSAGKTFVNAAIYGNDYGKSYGINNVHIIGQGNPILGEADAKDRPKNMGLVFELNFTDDLSVNGDISHFSSNGYEPIILVRPGADRRFKVDGQIYKKGRVLIAPLSLKSTATKL